MIYGSFHNILNFSKSEVRLNKIIALISDQLKTLKIRKDYLLARTIFLYEF